MKKLLPSTILCGFERGGTTLLSDVFRTNGFESGFECGVLMCDSPKEFLDFYPYNEMLISGWNLTGSVSDYIEDKDSFEDFYDRIIRKSGLCDKSEKFFDKTPIYMKEIGRCLSKAPFVDNAIIISRDPRSVFLSWIVREKNPEKLDLNDLLISKLNAYSKRYNEYFIGAISEIDNNRLLLISFENLCIDPMSTCKIIGSHIGVENFSHDIKRSRFVNVLSDSLDLSKVNEYEKKLTKDVQNKILESCSLSALFFGTNVERIKYIEEFNDINRRIRRRLDKFGYKAKTELVDGRYFNPWKYLFYNQDVLRSIVDPKEHFVKNSQKENRRY